MITGFCSLISQTRMANPTNHQAERWSITQNSKREIPEGWGVEKLGDIANITMGQSPKGTSYNEVGEGMLFFQGSTDFGWRFPVARQYTTEPSRIAEEDDILLC